MVLAKGKAREKINAAYRKSVLSPHKRTSFHQGFRLGLLTALHWLGPIADGKGGGE